VVETLTEGTLAGTFELYHCWIFCRSLLLFLVVLLLVGSCIVLNNSMDETASNCSFEL
jgi:hypothetical protein